MPPPELRFDCGVAKGSRVGTNYDLMLAKLISHGPDRDKARLRLIDGLETLAMPGVALNQAFLVDCLRAPVFAEGHATTGFLAETFPDGWQLHADDLLRLRGWAALALIRNDAGTPIERTDGFRVACSRRPATAPLQIEDDYGEAEITLNFGSDISVQAADRILSLDGAKPLVWRQGNLVYAASGALALSLAARPLSEARLSSRTGGQTAGQIVAPLAGLVTKVHVAAGDEVKSGAPLIEMEAMKLVHTLQAPFDGRIDRVACSAGDTLGAKTIVIEMEETI